MKMPDASRLIDRIDDLPTLPRTILKITELVNNPKSSARDLARVITDDQVLTARLLKLVNSSFYGFPQRIATVTGAIVLLGFDAIRNLLLTTSVFDVLSRKDMQGGLKQEEFWDHSLGCAVGAKVIANHIRKDKVEELFVSGLLHDIGKIVEMMFLPEEFTRITTLVNDRQILIWQAETEVLGYTHAQIGKLLAEKWNLPPKLISIISHHHEPGSAGAFTLDAAVVHLADIFCRALEIGFGGDDQVPPLDQVAWQTLKIKTDSFESIMAEMQAEFEDISSFLTSFP